MTLTPAMLAVLEKDPKISSTSNLSMNFPRITSPAPPLPSPPKNSTLGGPQLNIFVVLHGSNPLGVPTCVPKILH